MKWNLIQSPEQIEKIKEESKSTAVLIFKHSTRCNISAATLDRLERNWKEEEMANVKPYFLDLLSYRQLSNQIAEEFGIEHESPQVMIIRNEKPSFNVSHFQIDYQRIRDQVKS